MQGQKFQAGRVAVDQAPAGLMRSPLSQDQTHESIVFTWAFSPKGVFSAYSR